MQTLKPADVHLSAVETAKRLRVELKRAFPSTAFSIRCASFAGGSSLDVRYTDGPARDAVEPFVQAYGGRGFDGMTDSTYYNGGDLRLSADGPVSYSCSAFLNVHRTLSAAALLAVAQVLDKSWDDVLGPNYISPREADVMDLRDLAALTAPVRDVDEARARALAVCPSGKVTEAWPNGAGGRALVSIDYPRGTSYYWFPLAIVEPPIAEDVDEPDLCPEHGPHTADYCPGCIERREALDAIEASFSNMAALPDDIAAHVAAELGKRGFDIVKRRAGAFYVASVWAGVDPALSDPFASADARDAHARMVWDDANQDYDTVFRLDVDEHGAASVAAFSNAELELRA